jgi:septum formation protein
MTRQLILASTSVPRRELLSRLQIPFTVIAPEVDETPLSGETPEALVKRLALAKARAVAEKFSDAVIIGADQVGVLDKQIQGKPLDYATATQQLTAASGKCLRFLTALAVIDTGRQTEEWVMEEFKVYYRDLTPAMIKNYLAREQPLQCAGSCKIDGLGIALIAKLAGDDFTALIGLPMIRLVELLEKCDVSVFNQQPGASWSVTPA